MRDSGVACPYFFPNETVRRVDDNQMLDTYVRAEAQQFRNKTVSLQDRAPLRTTSSVISLLDKFLLSHEPEDMFQLFDLQYHPA